MGDSPSSDSGQSDESIEAAERFDDQQTCLLYTSDAADE